MSPTRVILYPDKTASIQYNNMTNEKYLLQSYITEYNKDDKNKSFAITPSLYRINPGDSFQFRIENMKNNLPKDRESVFHINILAIPPITDNSSPSIQIGLNSKIKLFYRPLELKNKYNAEKLAENLQFVSTTNSVNIYNPSPFHITLDTVSVDNKRVKNIKDLMIKPFSELVIPAKNAKSIIFTTISDLGARTKKIEKRL
ncbi:fimbrial biogenesis chaperone [Escherichia coli]|nr:molecular chaperone [Escherichia coli]